jgi:hypothetical protein
VASRGQEGHARGRLPAGGAPRHGARPNRSQAVRGPQAAEPSSISGGGWPHEGRRDTRAGDCLLAARLATEPVQTGARRCVLTKGKDGFDSGAKVANCNN